MGSQFSADSQSTNVFSLREWLFVSEKPLRVFKSQVQSQVSKPDQAGRCAVVH